MSAQTIQPASEPPPPLVPREWRLRLDPLLLLASLGLIACSLVTLKGATANDIPSDPLYYVKRQAIYAGLGLVVMYGMSRFDYSRLRELRYPIYGVLIASLIGVLGLAQATRGAKSWIPLPGFNLQPSELGKVLLVVALAGFVVERMRTMGRDTTARVMLLGLFPTLVVMAEPDLGSASVYVAGTLALLFVAGAPWRHFLALLGLFAVSLTLVLAVAPRLGVEVLKPYQVDRLTAFMHPSEDPADAGYQQEQAKTAIGSGEKTGRGVQNATQTSLGFLPEHHTDFIYAVIGETYGFAGCALILSLYALLIWRGLHILTIAKNLFGALIAGGVTVMLLFQLFVNIGMNVGIMPITGVTAPLLSFGGSSMLSTFLALGLLHSVNAQARETTDRKGRATIFQ
ncbi:rod shape-determining protein RodA [Candidatus Solirubrobacter pratensis]|uniref:rod shape-determining protein RodA n=1 Tax=Candidatus Solirubrobacter pratensis TaxID=1298857 RepID=UPI00040DD947|nr:rod shape-determining protein RodA [Candidatus Solirubrobacter pratensis]